MKIDSIEIFHFRTIENLQLKFNDINAICGPNSCGKSNLLKAIQFAFQEDISHNEIYDNLSSWHRDKQGGPNLSIYINMIFSNCSAGFSKFAGVAKGKNITYNFRAYRRGKVERKLGRLNLKDNDIKRLLDLISVVYIPPIRDILSGGIEPFRQLLKNSLQKGRAQLNPKKVHETIVGPIKRRSAEVLSDLSPNVKAILHSKGVAIDTSKIAVSDLCDNVGINIKIDKEFIALENFGTGHQSVIIIDLFKRFGLQSPGETIYLFEEPDNHLHPTVINSVISELKDLSKSSQVILTTHSPILLRKISLSDIIALSVNSNKHTVEREIDLSHFTDREIRIKLDSFGLKAIEPLFCKRIVVVEGLSDATILETIIEKRGGKTCDQIDLLIIPADGKVKVTELCQLLEALDVEWYAILDWDAAISNELPIIVDNLTQSDKNNIDQSINTIIPFIESTNRRGNKAINTLNAIKNENSSGRSTFIYLQDSVIQNIMSLRGNITFRDAINLPRYLKNGSKTRWRDILKKYKIWLWSGTIEDLLLQNSNCESVIENILLNNGRLSRRISHNRKLVLQNKLHKLAHEPMILANIAEELENSGYLNRSEIHGAVDFIIARL